MDVDDLLDGARLADADVDTEAALGRTAKRWRARRQRRLVALGVCAVATVAAVAVVATGGRDEPVDVRTEPTPESTGTWRRMAPSPLSPRDQGVAVWTGEEMIVAGGNAADPCSEDADCLVAPEPLVDGAAYDPASDSWRRIADAPEPLVDGSAAWTGDEVLVLTGSTLWSYDPQDDQWSTLPEPPVEGLRDGAWTGRYWVFAAEHDGATSSDWMYVPAAEEWREIEGAPIGPTSERDVVWTGEEIVVVGSVFGDDPPVNGEYLAATVDPDTGDWRMLAESGIANNGATWIAVGDMVVNPTTGSEPGGLPTGGILDLTARTWRPLPAREPSDARASQTGFVGNAGGWAADGTWLFDPQSGRWHPVEPRHVVAPHPAAAVWTGEEILSWAGTTGIHRSVELTSDGWAYRPPPLPNVEAPSPPTTEPRPHECAAAEGSWFDLTDEPSPAGRRRWTDDDGCMVRTDVISDRQGAEHCGWEGIRLITLAAGFSRGMTGREEPITYARDPDGILAPLDGSELFVADAELPSAVSNPGLRHSDTDMFFVIAYPYVLYVRFADHVEKWPAVEPPVCR